MNTYQKHVGAMVFAAALAMNFCVAPAAIAKNAAEGSGTAWLWLTTTSVVDCAFTVKVDWEGYNRAAYLEVFVTEGYDGAMLVPKRIKIRPHQTTATVTTAPLVVGGEPAIFYPWAHLLNFRGKPIPSSLDFAGATQESCLAP